MSVQTSPSFWDHSLRSFNDESDIWEDTGTSLGVSQVSDAFTDSESSSRHLHKLINDEEFDFLHKTFLAAKGQKLEPEQLRRALEQCNVYLTDAQFEKLFLKINTNRDRQCDWYEFTAHLIASYEDASRRKDTEEALEPPINMKPRLVRSEHRYPIVRVDFCPTPSHAQDTFVATATNGLVHFYAPESLRIQKSGKAPSPNLRVAKTYVLDGVCMPDIRAFVVSSTERDLRVYDTTGRGFSLRLRITGFVQYVTAIFYYSEEGKRSKLVLGDNGGCVMVMEFDSVGRGLFNGIGTGSEVADMTYRKIRKGLEICGKLSFREFGRLHQDKVTQVYYSPTLNSFISSAETHLTSDYFTTSLVIGELSITNKISNFVAKKGVTAFAFDEQKQILATGGPDMVLRLWSPKAPDQPLNILTGHHAGISFIFIQDGRKVYSLDKKKIVMVWDLQTRALLQIYNDFTTFVSDSASLKAFYSDISREFILAGSKLAIVKCCPRLRLDLTDGNSHSRVISVVLYNALYEVIVTCGYDSIIIVWDPWTGTRKNLIRQAHTRVLHGEVLRVEITAACFDPQHQLLLTGARDGSLKVWNFNNGFCARELSIGSMLEVTGVHWDAERILAVGWNRRIVEFVDDSETGTSGEDKNGREWALQHEDDVLCAAVRCGDAMATSSYSGELVLWRLETGQAYRRFDAAEPAKQVVVTYGGKRQPRRSVGAVTEERRLSREHQRSKIWRHSWLATPTRSEAQTGRRISVIKLPTTVMELRKLSIQAMLFLEARPVGPEWGTLLAALNNGKILVWSHHKIGGYLGQFNAIHMAGDSVTAMATDERSLYLFTGTSLGYVKTWLLQNFCVPKSVEAKISMPPLRLKFPFLLRDFFVGRAKRSVRTQPLPLLVNSYKAHRKPISGLVFIEKSEILVSSSSDLSCRLWTLGGRYVGTLGSPVPWVEIEANEPLPKEYPHRVPPDLQRDVSFTTLRVLTDGPTKARIFRTKPTEDEETDEDEDSKLVKKLLKDCKIGMPLKEPILGKNFRMEVHAKLRPKPILDTSLSYIPVYAHLDTATPIEIRRPSTPDLLTRARTLNFIEEVTQSPVMHHN